LDDGSGCDAAAGDGIFSACYKPDNTNYGKWTVTAKALEKGNTMATNETYFHFNPGDTDSYIETGTGEDMEISTDKKAYYPGDKVAIFSEPANMTKGLTFIVPILPPRELKVDEVELTLSNGTYFFVDLPVTIPVLNVKRIYQPYWWFILVSLIVNLSLSVVMGKLQKKKGKK
jgi:hypothetical protein